MVLVLSMRPMLPLVLLMPLHRVRFRVPTVMAAARVGELIERLLLVHQFLALLVDDRASAGISHRSVIAPRFDGQARLNGLVKIVGGAAGRRPRSWCEVHAQGQAQQDQRRGKRAAHRPLKCPNG